MLSDHHSLTVSDKLCFRAHIELRQHENGGPARTRTWDQGIHLARMFPSGVDYLITRDRSLGCGTLLPVIKDTQVPR